VTPEAAAFLDKARECLAKPDGMIDRRPDEAGREAYLAALHAEQALIVERTGRVVKTHRGVQRELARLVRNAPIVDPTLQAFLGRAYNFKAIADYQIGPGPAVTRELASEAIDNARPFVAWLRGLIEPGRPVPSP